MRAAVRGSVFTLAVLAACRISGAHFKGVDDGGGGNSDGPLDGTPHDGPLGSAHAVLFTQTDATGSNAFAYLATRDALGTLTLDPAKTPIDTFVGAAGDGTEVFVLAKPSATPAYLRALSIVGSTIGPIGSDEPLTSCTATHAAAIPTQVLVGCAGQSISHAMVTGGMLSTPATQAIGNSNSSRGVAFSPSAKCAYISDAVGNMLHAFKVASNGFTLTEVGSAHAVGSGTEQLAVDDTGARVFAAGLSSLAMFAAGADCSIGAAVDTVSTSGGRVLVDSANSVVYVAGVTSVDTFHYAASLTSIDHHSVGLAIKDAALDVDRRVLYIVDSMNVTMFPLDSSGVPAASGTLLALPRATGILLTP